MGSEVSEAHLRVGHADKEIVALLEDLGGLVVVGSRGPGGMRGTLMGRVSDSVVRHAHSRSSSCAASLRKPTGKRGDSFGGDAARVEGNQKP